MKARFIFERTRKPRPKGRGWGFGRFKYPAFRALGPRALTRVGSILFILLFILISTANIQAETTISAEVEKTSITTDEAIAYKLMITSSEKKIPQPKFPDFNDFTVLSQAETSEISISKGKEKTFVVYVFIIAPTKIGRLKIEPAQIQIEKNTFSSQSFEIEVTQGKKQTQPESQEEQVEPQELPQEPAQPKITL